MFTIRTLTTKAEMLPILPLIQQLSPWITEESYDFMLDDMLAHDYRMQTVWEADTCVGVSGFWVSTKLYSGKYMEFDNVVIAETHRSKGIGAILSESLEKIARAEACKMLMLDAYIPNVKAHAFYERLGFEKKGYHFLKKLDAQEV